MILLFRNKFNKFNNTGARMLDSIYHMTVRLGDGGVGLSQALLMMKASLFIA